MTYDQQLVWCVLAAAGCYSLVRRRQIVDSMLRGQTRAELGDDPRMRRNGELFVGAIGAGILALAVSSLLWP